MHSIAIAVALQLLSTQPGRSPRAPRDGDRSAPAQMDVSTFPAEQKERYTLFRQKCAKCHSVSVALASPMTPAQWKRHAKRPGAALSDAQVRSIVEFLKFYASRRSSP